MSATTKLSFEEFLQLPSQPGKRYELDQGELIVEPSPTFRHNLIRDRIATHLRDFVVSHRLGNVVVETDFRLQADVVRNPDVAFVGAKRLQNLDIDKSPIEGAPDLAIEVVSPANSAQDMLTKVHQYLAAGSQAVWVFYPNLKLAEIHDAQGVREITAPAALEAATLFPGLRYALALADMFNEDKLK
jgi:Uma2 family endonuclease